MSAVQPSTIRESGHRGLFFSAAVFNLLAGLPFLVATQFAANLTGLELNATAKVFIHVVAGLIVMFGAVYAMIARDPVRYREYIPLGLVLKILVVAVIYGWWLSGAITWRLPAIAFGDIVFAVLFWRYYRRTASTTATTSAGDAARTPSPSNSDRNLFRVAAGFNLLAGIPLLIAMHPVARLLGLEVNTAAGIFIHIAAGVIIAFGVAYVFVARDPVRYRAYIPLGIAVKIYFLAVVTGWWLAGGIQWPLPALATGEIVFVALFLRNYRGSAA